MNMELLMLPIFPIVVKLFIVLHFRKRMYVKRKFEKCCSLWAQNMYLIYYISYTDDVNKNSYTDFTCLLDH